MTDARVGKTGVKILVTPTPIARVGKTGVKILTTPPPPEARVGKTMLKILVSRATAMTLSGSYPEVKLPDGTWRPVSFTHIP